MVHIVISVAKSNKTVQCAMFIRFTVPESPIHSQSKRDVLEVGDTADGSSSLQVVCVMHYLSLFMYTDSVAVP